MNELIEQLKILGLNEKEAQVYLASLDTGPVTMAHLAKKAKIKRPTAYYVIEALIEKGLMVKLPKGRRMLYRAENPKKFNQLFKAREQIFEKVLPELIEKYRNAFKEPKISFHEGKESVYQVYENIFSSGKTMYALVSMEDYFNLFTVKDNAHFFNLLKKYGGYLYDIFQHSQKAREFKKHPYRKDVSRTKILPPQLTSPIDMFVAGDTVLLVSLKIPSAVVIKDEAIAASQKMLLQSLWKQAR